ncbi:MAG: amidohydrolase family protein [Terriglobia bacterium]
MKKVVVVLMICLGVAAASLVLFQFPVTRARAASQASGSTALAADLAGFASIDPIDTHTHLFKNDPALYAVMKRLHLHVLDICVADRYSIFGPLPVEIKRALVFVHASQGHAALCTTFDPFKYGQPDFTQNAIKQINENFAEGAIAVKIWKNIGMELKAPNGKYVMPDDPAFEPIYKDIAAHNKTLVAHLAEPDSCWLPPNPKSPDYEYYKENPEWYMYRHPGRPSKQQILTARDHLVAENPNLRVVGAHLGSMERNIDEIERDLDRYPNFAVDTAARMEYLMLAPRQKARNFLIKYQDRVIFGTDTEIKVTDPTPEAIQEWEGEYARDWKFLATDGTLEYKGQKIEGLKLPGPVLRKIFHDNAVHWFPGILGSGK